MLHTGHCMGGCAQIKVTSLDLTSFPGKWQNSTGLPVSPGVGSKYCACSRATTGKNMPWPPQTQQTQKASRTGQRQELSPTRRTKGQLSASSSTCGRTDAWGGTASATGAGEGGGLPGPHAHLCSPSATARRPAASGRPGAGWPWAAADSSVSQWHARSRSPGRGWPCAGAVTTATSGSSGSRYRASRALLQARRESRSQDVYRQGTLLPPVQWPPPETPVQESDTLSPLLGGTSQHSYIHRTLFSHHILPKQFFTWNLLTNKREGTTDTMVISKEIKSVLILKLKKCLVFHQPLILNEPERGWGGGHSARKRALSNGVASPFTAWSQEGALWSPDTSLWPCPTVTCSTSSARVSTRTSPFKKQNTYTGLGENCWGWHFTSWFCWWVPDCTFIKTCQTVH